MSVLNNLKRYRERAGLSQTKLSELSGCARSYISEVEMGHQKLTLKMAEKFAPHLHCSAFDLLGADAIKYTGSFTESLGALVLGNFDEFLSAVNAGEVDEYSNDLFWMLFAILSKKFSGEDVKVLRAMAESLGAKYADR